MEPITVTCTSPAPVTPSGPSPKSPLEDTPPSPNHTPPADSEKTVAPASERTASPEPNCAICLGKSQNKSFTDSCLHQFCFNCLLEWSKIKPECPLCKQSFKSIIHNVRSNEDYDQYHLRPEESAYPWINMINIDMVQQRFRYRSTLTADRRMERALVHLEQDLQRRVEPGDIIPPQRTWRRRRGLAPDDFRVNVYNQNLWVSSLPCVGSGRDISPQNFRAHPEEVHRLIPWLNRELQAVLRSPGLSARVLDLVITQLPRHHMHSPEFRFQLESYLRQHYDHFIHEFNTFARSPYDMIGFDENANYTARQNMVEEVHEVSSDSSDSDIVILPQEPSQSTSSVTVMSLSPVPGPSRVAAVLPVDQASDSDINISNCPSDEAQASQSEIEDSDACIIVGYVKPRHERTPEIITLLSSDPEAEVEDEDVDVEVLHPLTCDACCDRSFEHSVSSSPSSPESSGSEYAPSYAQRKKKKVQRKKKSVSTSKTRGHSKRKPATKSQPRRKQIYTSSDSSSECSCSGKKTVQRRRRAESPSSCRSSSSDSDSSSSSSSSDPPCKSRSSHSWHRNKKGSWRIQINVPEMKQEYGYNHDPPYTSSEINDFLASGSSSNSRPKLRSIVITRATNGEANYRESSGTKQRKTLTKSHREDKKVKEEEPSTSTAHHRSSSHSSHSSHRRAGTSRRKHGKKDNKKKSKRRKESESSPERKLRTTKPKKRKRLLSLFSDSSGN